MVSVVEETVSQRIVFGTAEAIDMHRKEWEMWMTHVDRDKDGNWYGWGRVLDYIGVKWQKPWIWVEAKRQAEAVEQLTMEGI